MTGFPKINYCHPRFFTGDISDHSCRCIPPDGGDFENWQGGSIFSYFFKSLRSILKSTLNKNWSTIIPFRGSTLSYFFKSPLVRGDGQQIPQPRQGGADTPAPRGSEIFWTFYYLLHRDHGNVGVDWGLKCFTLVPFDRYRLIKEEGVNPLPLVEFIPSWSLRTCLIGLYRQ